MKRDLSKKAEFNADRLMKGKKRISFIEVSHLPLAPFLWDCMQLSMGERICVETQSEGEDERTGAEESVKALISQEWSRQELITLFQEALTNRMRLIIDPAEGLANLIILSAGGGRLKAKKIIDGLRRVAQTLEPWDPNLTCAVSRLIPYIASLKDAEIEKKELKRLISSAVEKEFASYPLPPITAALLAYKFMAEAESEGSGNTESDCAEAAIKILEKRGMNLWISAIQVEIELCGPELSAQACIDTLKRLTLYQNHGLIGAEPEDVRKVDDEMGEFAQFIEEITT